MSGISVGVIAPLAEQPRCLSGDIPPQIESKIGVPRFPKGILVGNSSPHIQRLAPAFSDGLSNLFLDLHRNGLFGKAIKEVCTIGIEHTRAILCREWWHNKLALKATIQDGELGCGSDLISWGLPSVGVTYLHAYSLSAFRWDTHGLFVEGTSIYARSCLLAVRQVIHQRARLPKARMMVTPSIDKSMMCL